MTNHTPGPWIADGSGAGLRYIYDPTDSYPVAFVQVPINGVPVSDETAQANRRLIAAAPELLEALIEMLADLPEIQYVSARFFSAVDDARAIIAKAAGDAP